VAMRTTQARVRRAIAAVSAGRPVVVTDEIARDGHLVFAADAATPKLMAFTVRHTSGYVRAALPVAECERLNLPPMCERGGGRSGAAAHRVSVDVTGTGTGISASDRALTIAALAASESTASDFRRPGHVVPVGSAIGGVLAPSRGAAEAAVDLAGMAGRRRAGVFCEIVSRLRPTAMARGPELATFADEHGLPVVSIAEIAAYRLRTEPQVIRTAETTVPSRLGDYRVVGYRGIHDGAEHMAVIIGAAGGEVPMPVHVHVECLTGDVFGSLACRCGGELDNALAEMSAQSSGMVIYLRPPGSVRACGLSDGEVATDLMSETVAWILRDLGVYTIRLSDDARPFGLVMFGAIREHGLRIEPPAAVWPVAG
jgi:3,4-dihydroxy 2-butanone 4-phosphate synthase/GTP cyclohydrolase II